MCLVVQYQRVLPHAPGVMRTQIGGVEWPEVPNADSFTICVMPALRAASMAVCCSATVSSPMLETRNNVFAPLKAVGNVSGLARSPVTHVMPGRFCALCGLRTSARAATPCCDDVTPYQASASSHENH